MRIRSRLCGPVGLTVVLLLATTLRAAPVDRAARGMDLFVHAPDKVAAGGRLSIQVRVFGFPTVATLTPLPGARVEAMWDPESLGGKVTTALPVVTVTADDAGRAHLEVEVPEGKTRLNLLVSARWRDHARTRDLTVERLVGRRIDLRVSDTAVVPGAAVSSWVFVRDVASGLPVPEAEVDVELKEGLVARFSRRVSTDRAGMAAVQVPVPYTDNPDWRWRLTARTAFGTGNDVDTEQELRVREETPGTPQLSVNWSEGAAPPGTRASFQVQVRDGAGAAIAGLPVLYTLGPTGMVPPKDDLAWQRSATAATTDGDGHLATIVQLPSTIARRAGHMVTVRVAVQGRTLWQTDTLALETPSPRFEVIPEFGELLPGLTQRLFLHATLGARPLSAGFAIDGHGLSGRVRTSERGWGQVTWNVPRDVGARVPSSAPTGCAGAVAATVRVRPTEAMAAPGSPPRAVDLCVAVNREVVATIQPSRPLVRAGEQVQVHRIGQAAPGGQASGESSSVLLAAPELGLSAGGWLPATSRSGAIGLPTAARGLWTISAAPTMNRNPRGRAAPDDADDADDGAGDGDGEDDTRDTSTLDPFQDEGENPAAILAGKVLVVPRVLPALTARLAGPPSATARSVDIEADLSDGHGRPLVGSVGAVVIDKHGGADPDALLALDTRRAAVAPLNVAPEDADAFLEGDARFDIERWAALARAPAQPVLPVFDPAATVDAHLDQAFAAIVRSLEGGVFQASGDPERLRDVRIRSGNRFALNPEMLTLTTEAMQTPPLTPGGEPWRLADLMAIDRQVTYDHVARRVTRLKLFRVLSALRAFLHENKLGPDEPMLSDPNALLRRLVARRKLAATGLLDPWGNGLSFVRAGGPRVPFLSIIPGYHLLSAGPDGRFGTTDDVRDPFQRVLSSRTPYARAVKEDRIVDARWDMNVGDGTVESWKATLEKLTGMSLGDQDAGPEDLSNLGTIGKGGGYGHGAGRSGGRRVRALGPADWVPPVRTDERGHVRLTVPLRDLETTWQVLLVAVPDQGTPAVSSLDVPVSAGLSVSADAGARWIVGDRVGVAITLHNRTQNELSVTLRVAVSGAAALAESGSTPRVIKVAARSLASVVVPVHAPTAGTGTLEATVETTGAPAGIPSNAVRLDWPVLPAGEAFLSANVSWLEREATLAVPGNSDQATATGPARLVLERGVEPALAAVLDALPPERLTGLNGIADALEVFGRVRSWATVRGGERDPLAVRALHLAGLALARRESLVGEHRKNDWRTDYYRSVLARARFWEGPATGAADGQPSKASSRSRDDAAARSECPPSTPLPIAERLDWLDLAALAGSHSEAACWPAFVTSTLQQLAATQDPRWLAHALLAVLDRPSHTLVAGALADRLRALVPVQLDGRLALPPVAAGDRATRSIVMTALVRSRALGTVSPTTTSNAARLATRLLAERDADGGYGSVLATRIVVRALLESEAPEAGVSAPVQWSELLTDGRAGAQGRVALVPKQPSSVALSVNAASVKVTTSSPGVVVRVERPMLRSFRRWPAPTSSPLSLQLEAPVAPTTEATALLQVSVRHELNRRAPVVIRVPLPPGAMLADKVDGVRQVQGALYIRATLDADPLPRVVAIPLRFGLSGTVTLPEAVARIEDEEFPAARAPARPLVIAQKR